MAYFQPEPAHAHDDRPGIGILVVNLGTPDAPEKRALRRYLKQFLSDRRVVEIPRLPWWLILNGVILNTRPVQSARKYAAIWTPAGSPLRVYTEQQAQGLARILQTRTQHRIEVVYAMRYGQPDISSGLERLKAAGCDRLLLFPLYPQYASSTTGSSQDALFATLQRWRNLPELRVIRHYSAHPAYIGALAHNIEEYWKLHGHPEKLLLSFHGVPRYSLEQGDPYFCECHKTGRLVAEALNLGPEQYNISFQSLFGRAKWVEPQTATLVQQFARAGVSTLHVVCPGFPADCLETLEEIEMEVRASFITHGGRNFHYIPALNASARWLEGMAQIALEHLGNWLNDPPSPESAAQQAAARQRRARALGAVR